MSGRRRSSPWASSDLRHQLADEAARLMVEHGIQDFSLAKRKAAERLGVRTRRGALPSNAQIQERLVERQRLFEPEAHDRWLAKLRLDRDGRHGRARRLSTEARRRACSMGRPRVSSPIELHVFSDSPEAVAVALEDARLPPARQPAALSLRPRGDRADSGLRPHGRRRRAAGHGVPRARTRVTRR